jgi:chromosomal replication initiation ATPase DnaA
MIIDIPQPDHESRIAILTKKARLRYLFAPRSSTSWQARSTATSATLRGIINTLLVHIELKGKELSVMM